MTKPNDAAPKGGMSDHTGRYVIQPNGRTTPLSPHMEVWRWHGTMLASILFRATIIASGLGSLFLLAWLATLALGPLAYGTFLSLAASPLGLFVGFGLTVVLFSLLLNGGRHLLNDAVIGLDLKSANLLSQLAIWGPPIAAVLFWVVLFSTGRVSL